MTRFISIAVLLSILMPAGLALAEETKPAETLDPAAMAEPAVAPPAAPKIDTGDTAI